jgi:nicotinamide-nucleotide amidase
VNTTNAREHETAAILSTGDELLLGQLQDANARWLAESLTSRGVRVVEIGTVPDDLEALTGAIVRLSAVADVLVITGGLGPTDGDLTRAALCAAFGDSLVTDDAQVAALTEKLARRGRAVNEKQLRQTQRPSRARCLANAFGTAPGLVMEKAGGGLAIALPGPPNELHPMWRDCALGEIVGVRMVRTRLQFVVGVPEADLATMLKDMTGRDRVPLVGMTASAGIITIRQRCEGGLSVAAAEALLDADEAEIRRRVGRHVVATRQSGDEASHVVLASGVIARLAGRGWRIGVGESCTGGLLGSILTSVPGSSSAVAGGVIAYGNEVKTRLLGVRSEVIAAHGAVSTPVAEAMARGAMAATGAQVGVGITGIAGPGGATEGKAVGTVCVSVARVGAGGEVETDTREFSFPGTREDVRLRAAVSALAMVWFASGEGGGGGESGAAGSSPGPEVRGTHAGGFGGPRLLWQRVN